MPASADESQFPDAVELHSPGLDDFDAEVVSSELVFAPRFPEGPTIVHVPSPELQARCVEGSSESASPPYQSPTQLSAEKLWHSDVDSQSQSQSFHSFSTRTNSTARAAVESSSFSFLSQGTVGKDTLWDPPSGGGTTHAWGASAPAVVCQSRDASHNGGRSEPGSTGQSGFPISATVRAHDGWRQGRAVAPTTAEASAPEPSAGEVCGKERVHTANVEPAVVQRSAKHILGRQAAGLSEEDAAISLSVGQQHRDSLHHAPGKRAEGEGSTAVPTGNGRLQAARRRKRHMQEAAAAPHDVSAPSGGAAAPTREQQRKLLEQMLPPGVFNKILEQAGEMDEEEFADFLHAFELACTDDPPSPCAATGGDTTSCPTSSRAVCENTDHSTQHTLPTARHVTACEALKLAAPLLLKSPRHTPQVRIVSTTDEDSGSFCEDAEGDAAERSLAQKHASKGRYEPQCMLQEPSRSVSRSDIGESSPLDTTPRSEDRARKSPTSKLVHECERALGELLSGGGSQGAWDNSTDSGALHASVHKAVLGSVNSDGHMHGAQIRAKDAASTVSVERSGQYASAYARLRSRPVPRVSSAVAEGMCHHMHDDNDHVIFCAASATAQSDGTVRANAPQPAPHSSDACAAGGRMNALV